MSQPLANVVLVDNEQTSSRLNPTQERTLGLLRRPSEPVVFNGDQISSFISDFSDAFDHLTARVTALDTTLFISKGMLTSVLGCEEHFQEKEEFRWSVPTAIGTVAHRAIELLTGWRGAPYPATLVDESIARLGERPNSLGDFLNAMTEGDRADLRNAATDRVVKFTESFPPLQQSFIPVAESSIRWPETGPIVLGGKSDLTLGRAEHGESRKVIIDLKTGGAWPNHMDELRFYALLETLRTGIPPRLIAGFYLDAGRAVPEEVTIETLGSAMRRTLDGIGRAVELLRVAPPFDDRNHLADGVLSPAIVSTAPHGLKSNQLTEIDRTRITCREGRPQVCGYEITLTVAPKSRWSQINTASSGSARIQPLVSPRSSEVPTESSG